MILSFKKNVGVNDSLLSTMPSGGWHYEGLFWYFISGKTYQGEWILWYLIKRSSLRMICLLLGLTDIKLFKKSFFYFNSFRVYVKLYCLDFFLIWIFLLIYLSFKFLVRIHHFIIRRRSSPAQSTLSLRGKESLSSNHFRV